ncbi:MAG: PD-(D/E)XK nuclease family protein [Campylobacteraceae bacterium]|jgi:RecB family exonuclease|nr:PD-(D/E)XK nuclease family protein [Campylobacteraceae bacterium]
MTEIFSTARQIREFYESFSHTNQLLSKAVTIAEFESKAWYVPNRILADDDTRSLLMREAASFENFKKLKIPREFMAFLQNSEYLFRFFEELSNEETDIEQFDLHDTYAEFGEHIAILKELLTRYCALLDKNTLYDGITLPKLAHINSSYLSSLGEIRIHLEGYLSAFEIRLLREARKFCRIRVLTPITIYNKKVKKWLEEEGITTSFSTLCECDLNEGELLKETKLYDKTPKIFYQPFTSDAFQSAFVFEKIEMMTNLGIAPQNIAVVLPDESFALVLKEFDRFNNLNFAMGFGMRTSLFYQRGQAVLKYAKDDEIEHKKRVERLGIGADALENLSKKTASAPAASRLKAFIKEDDPQEETQIILSELFLFEKFLDGAGELPFLDILQLFLKRLQDKSLDDNSGGKVTVMGALESRGVKYEGVIIVHFNDDIVPKRSNKDLFISSSLRAKCGLPSVEDRENLQRFFYDRLINNARVVAISAVENEDKLPSRFLKTLNFTKLNYDENSYADIIIKKAKTPKIAQKSFRYEHNFFEKPLSNSRLKTYLECSLKYFFRYIKGYEEPKQFKHDARDVGNFVHDILYTVLEEPPLLLEDMKKRAKEIAKATEEKYPKSALWELERDIWLFKLESVFAHEIKRYEEGWRVFEREVWHSKEVDGVPLAGKIDRMDKRGGEWLVLDYKTGRIDIPKREDKAYLASDFQLEFYALLCEDLGEIKTAFYDLNEAKLVEESLFELKKMRLLEHLQELKEKKEFVFEAVLDKKRCLFCPYKMLCGVRI